MNKKPLRLRIRENQKESYTFHKQAVQAKKTKTKQNKHNQALTTISFSPKLLIDLYTFKSTQNIHGVSHVNGDTERFKRVPEDSLPRLDGKHGAGVPGYGARGTGSQGVENTGCGKRRVWKTRGQGGKHGVWWKTRGLSGKHGFLMKKHGETIFSPRYEFSLLNMLKGEVEMLLV